MSIKQKLITILLFAGLLPTFVVSVVAYVAIGNQLRANASSQLASIAIKQQETINSLLQNKQEQVSQFSNAYNLQFALTTYTSKHDVASLATINSIIQKQQLTDPTDIQSVSIATADGKIVASTVNGSVGQAMNNQILGLINAGNDNATTILRDPSDGIDKLNIATTITVNDKVAALMNVKWSLSDVIADIQDYTGLGQTGETIVAKQDAAGHAISLFPLRFDTNAGLTTNLDSMHLFAHENVTTYSGVKDYRNNEVTVSARPIGIANAVIATKMNNKEILAPIKQLKNALLTIAIISMALMVALAWYVALVFTRPILGIATTARKIGQGELSARTDIRRKDELGALATSINAMGQSLQGQVTSIETQRNQLQIILDSTAESIIAIDKDGTIIIANQATSALSALPIDGLVKRRFKDIFTFTKAGENFDIPYDKPGTNVYADLQYMTKTYVIHYVKVIVSQVRSSNDQEQSGSHTIVTIHDETRSRELEAMKVDFVSMAAHELRTPLAAISGYLELLKIKERENLQGENKRYVDQALISAKELGDLINNLLDVTRIEKGTLALHMEEVDLAASAHQAVQDAYFTAQKKNISLSYAGEENNCMVGGDEVALREIINNLLTNAINTPKTADRSMSTSANADRRLPSV
ncbi:MAG TPA: histidine kinase dimerization/phospho-acceptor domain-containing protein [Candidatus Saccharimonadales bacterium]|nr:histidine kinase dimerization/phospho-acceptor domain-containing protein [Candidatus Saccharimonadales bacterium]